MDYDISQLEELSQILLTEKEDPEKLHYSFIGLRKLLSLNVDTPIQAVIDLNLPQKLIEFMDCEKYPHLILEATWCCCNISTGTSSQIQRLIDKGLVPKLIRLLYCNSGEIYEQAAWCVANIAADCGKFKNILIHSGCVVPLADKILQTNDLQIIKNSTWSLANVCRGKNSYNQELAPAAKAFIKVIMAIEDLETVSDALMGLSDVMNEAVINTITDSPILPKMKEYCKYDQRAIQLPLLRIVAFVTNGTDEQTQKVIDTGFLDEFFKLLANPKQDKRIVKEILWIVSNISIGTVDQIDATIVKEDRYQLILKYALGDNVELKKEAVWSICNATKNATEDQIEYMVNQNLLDLFSELLVLTQKEEILLTILEALNFVFKKAKYNEVMESNPFIEKVITNG